MFYNISNHPSESWSKKQIKCAGGKENIVDITFPYVNGSYSSSEIKETVINFIRENEFTKNDTVFVVGEYTFVFAFVDYLLSKGIKVVHSLAKLKIENYIKDGKNTRLSKFNFIEFREYRKIKADKSPFKPRNKILINASARHRMSNDDQKMIEKSREIGEIVEYPIESILEKDEDAFKKAVMHHIDYIENINPNGVILDGEYNTFFTIADVLLNKGYDVYIKCSDRKVQEYIDDNGETCKITTFEFIQYRKLFRLEECK